MYWDVPTQPSLEFTLDRPKKKKKAKITSYLQISRLKCSFDARIQVVIARLFQASRPATVNNRSLQSKHAECIAHGTIWRSATAEDHTGCSSCQPRTGNRGYS